MKLAQVIRSFHDTFTDQDVIVAGGFNEPFYRAARDGAPAEIRFNRDFLNSCLHEIAHWCIAGKDRRARDDYGYWYRPDGRNGAEQVEFFRAEAGPQAVEWSFALACGEPFRMSLDNLGGEVSGQEEFAAALEAKMEDYLKEGFPPRAARFQLALMARFQPGVPAEGVSAWLRNRKDASGYPASSRIDSQ